MLSNLQILNSRALLIKKIIDKIVFGELFLMLSLIVVAAVVRTYHFSEWLHFELDQARDAVVVHSALRDGFSTLPLLGPQARGGGVFLGPVFYYFQYLAGLVLGPSPESFAVPDLLFSVGGIVVLFCLLRRFLRVPEAAAVSLLASVSVFLVTYGRFAWNPNGMFFFSLLLGCALLRVVERPSGIRWWSTAGFSLGVLMNLHFVAFFSMPLLVVSFLALRREAGSLLRWLVLSVFLVLPFVPVIVSESSTGFSNTRAIVGSVSGRTTGDESGNHSFPEKVFRATQETALAGWMILSGNEAGEPVRTKGMTSFICDSECRYEIPALFAGLAITLAGIVMLFRQAFLSGAADNPERVRRRDAASLGFLWMMSVGLALIPVAYDISPRFFLLLAPVFFLHIGMLFPMTTRREPIRRTVIYAILAVLVTLNLWSTLSSFSDRSRSARELVLVSQDRILGRSEIITLASVRMAAEVAAKAHISGEPLLLVSDNRYARSIFYVLSFEKGLKDVCYLKRSDFEEGPMKIGNVVFVLKASDEERLPDGFRDRFEIVDTVPAGSFTVYRARAKAVDPNGLGCYGG